MLMPAFEFSEPTSLKALQKALKEGRPRARIVAGGTDLLPDMKREYDRRLRFPSHPSFRDEPFPEKVVSIAKISTLKGMLFPRRGTIRIGALTTMAELANSTKVVRQLLALARAAGCVGTPQVRNRASLGGNLCNARPCADTAPAAIALGASVELESAKGARRMVRVEEFFEGPGQTVLEPNEVLVAVHLPQRNRNAGSAYLKLGTRKETEITQVSVAAMVVTKEDIVEEARIALGSVGPVPMLAEGASLLLQGKKALMGEFRRAARKAASEAKPIDDFRATAKYRMQMVEVLAFRALKEALADAKEGH